MTEKLVQNIYFLKNILRAPSIDASSFKTFLIFASTKIVIRPSPLMEKETMYNFNPLNNSKQRKRNQAWLIERLGRIPKKLALSKDIFR